MARLADRLPENAPGSYYVDRSCIDCDTCRQIAPAVFAEDERVAQSIVTKQPANDQEKLRAAMALVACPTSSIGSADKRDVASGVAAFPERIGAGLYYCGFASESSYGASSYLITRTRGNVLVDSPRAAKPLLARIEALGGVATMFLTHRDDVADHAVFHARFGCERVMDERDAAAVPGLERALHGDDPIELADDLLVIPVPGHTRGSAALLHRGREERVLFTGDHLWWSDDARGLVIDRSVCWYSWPEQRRSLRRLLDFEFTRVLPGHGRGYRVDSIPAMRRELERAIARAEH